MLNTSRPAALAGLVVLAVWLAPIPEVLEPTRAGLAMAQDPSDPGASRPGTRTTKKAQRGRGKAAPSRKAAPAEADEPTDAPGTDADAKSAPGEISFAKEIAPILVANCAGCHRPGRPGVERGKLDLTTYENMMKGATGGELAVVAGKPDESHMVLRVKGEETPRMPQGNDVSLSDEAIGRIERWIQGGAKLDPGLKPQAEIASYAASPQEMRRAELAKLSPDEQLKRIEEAGLERWSKTNADLKPEIASSEHFVIFGVMPKERATATLKTMEGVLGQLKRAVSPDVAKWGERVSLYVFPEERDYVEFIRTFKKREVSAGEAGDTDLKTQQPYVAIADPGAEEPETAAPRRGGSRRRGGADAPEANDRRTAAGLLTENLVGAAVMAYGKSPAWLADGLALYLAEQAERGGSRYQRLRAIAFDAFRQGWATKATETLGGGREMSADEFKAISFALVECLASPQYQRLFPAFAKGMSQGPEKFDDVVKEVYGAPRDVFLNVTGEWIATAYGNVR